MIISLVTMIGTATASVSQNRLRNTSRSWPACASWPSAWCGCSCMVRLRQRVGVARLAVIGAEPHVDVVVAQVRGGVVRVDLHPADRIDRELARAEATTVAVQPIDDDED